MTLIVSLKNFLQNKSESISFLRFIPFSLRFGYQYVKHKKLLESYCKFTDKEKEDFHFKSLKKILNDAYNNNKFYKCFYDLNGFNPSEFKKLSDWEKVPIVNKAKLKKYNLYERSNYKKGALLLNTGGTSGEPFDFFVDSSAFAREWAYMHHIWSKLDYSYLDLKLSFRGKSNNGTALKYNVIHNEFVVDAYIDLEEIIKAILVLSLRKKIKYIHGYPSAIYLLAKKMKEMNISSDTLFNGSLKGVFLGSEYPAPIYRNVIDDIFHVKSISWYGHSEMSILCFENNEKYSYEPFQTYGFVEAVNSGSKNSKLVGTSYYNNVSHFIRYDSSDLILKDTDEQPLKSFKVSEGRVGDFVLDKNNAFISLTALIFGRHHIAFSKADFIQVKQEFPGEVVIYVTTNTTITLSDFDLKNIEMNFKLNLLETPFKTKSGKIPLLIK